MKLTNHDRSKVIIVDDSSEQNCSKPVKLLARCFDHASQNNAFLKGFSYP
nr:hypothetical protein [Gracilibacillus kekensis]